MIFSFQQQSAVFIAKIYWFPLQKITKAKNLEKETNYFDYIMSLLNPQSFPWKKKSEKKLNKWPFSCLYLSNKKCLHKSVHILHVYNKVYKEHFEMVLWILYYTEYLKKTCVSPKSMSLEKKVIHWLT